MQDHAWQTPIIIPEETTTVMPHETDIPVTFSGETTTKDILVTCDERVRILTYQLKGRSLFGRMLKKSKAVSSPFVVIPQTKRPKFDDNWNMIVDESTTVDIDPMRGIDDFQLDIELNQ